jgi:hypothetical protein
MLTTAGCDLKIVPRLPFEQIQAGDVDPSILERIKETGTVIIEGAISKEVSSFS